MTTYINQKRAKRGPCLTVFLLIIVILIFCSCMVIRLVKIKPEKETYTYPLTSDAISNPLMGWAPWATIVESNQPHTLVYADLTWREFEPQEGVYEFGKFEAENQLDRWREEGKRVVFRFVLDKPGDEPHLDIPDWLYDKIGGDGQFYESEYGFGFSPNYANEALIEYHNKVIKELGNRYSIDDFFAYIELGSLGHWGEWHVNTDAGIEPLPDESVRDTYVRQYKQAFPDTHLLMRRPFNIASELNLGLYNDVTGGFKSTLKWLDWIQNGGEYAQTGEENGMSPMPEGWKIAPIGGEQSTSLSDEEMYGALIEQTKTLLQLSHTTFIGPGSPYDVLEGSALQSGIDQVLSTIGYRLIIENANFQTNVGYCSTLDGDITFSNKGIAPIYYNWPIYIYIFDEYQTIVFKEQQEFDLRSILPNDLVQMNISLPIKAELKNGTYSLGLAIVDPLTNEPVIKFAMINERPDLIFHLGNFEIKRPELEVLFAPLSLLCGLQ